MSKAHLSAQYALWGVTSTTTATSFTFHTISNTNYTSLMYCYTTEKYFYPLKTAVTVTSVDNGGKPVNLQLNYPKAFDDVTNNEDVLKIC